MRVWASRIAFLLILLAMACGISGPNVEARPTETAAESREPVALQLELRNGSAVDGPAQQRTTTKGTPLSDKRIEEILKMFSEPLAVELDKPAFLKRPDSQPAPRSARPVEIPFPPTADGPDAPRVTTKPLSVLSISPEGKTERAPRLAISFSAPMIAVSDPSQAEVEPLGIQLEPQPKGKWRWLGTQTLIFEPEGGEFPRATTYKVVVPAGTKDVNEIALTAEAQGEFTLPRPKVISTSPNSSSIGLKPLIQVRFDQPVVRESTLKKIHLKDGQQEIPLKPLSLAQAEELEKGALARYEKAEKDTYFLFAASRELKKGTNHRLTVDKDVESQEGPRRSDQTFENSFTTYMPLRLTDQYPDKGEDCSPFQNFNLYFNNDIDRKAFEDSFVTLDPPINGMKLRVRNRMISIQGAKRGKTSYKVTVSAKLKDKFGQTLGTDQTRTLKTGRAPKVLSSGFETMTVLDPTVKPTMPLFSTNIDKLDMEIYRVQPSDWPRFLEHMRYRHDPDMQKPLPGKRITKSVSLKGKPDELVTTHLDLSEYFDNGVGNVIVHLTDPAEDKEDYRNREIFTWVQGTKLGLDMEVAHDKVVALTTRLSDGKSVSGALVTIGSASAQSGKKGLAVFAPPSKTAPIATVRHQGDVAFLPRSTSPYGYNSGWHKRGLSASSRWFFFDDRGLYKPGETAHIKGYTRRWQRGPQGQLENPVKEGTVSWTLTDSRGNKLKEGKTELTAFGTLELKVELPPNTNLGYHQVRFSGAGLSNGTHSLNVQEFRKPEFEVKTSTLTDQPHILHGKATVAAEAVYYAGGGLAGSTVDWQVSTSASSYTPPGRGKYTFGRWTPWWDLGCWWRPSSGSSSSSYFNFQGTADSAGEHKLEMEFLEVYPPRPTTVTATASVADVNRQMRSGSTSLLVHPSQRYVGLKSEKSFVDEKSKFTLQTIVTDVDGKLLTGIPVEFSLLKVSYELDDGHNYKEVETVVQTLKVTSKETPLDVTLEPKEGGTYRIRAEVKDDKGRLNRTDYTMWKAGGTLPSKDKVEVEVLTLVPDRKEYEPGQTSKILVMAPFAEGEGLVVWARDGVLKEERFTLKNGTATIGHPLTEEMIPNLHARITVVGKSKWGKRDRPAIARGNLNLAISKESRRLTVEVLPSLTETEPGAEVELEVLVKDHKGEPVRNSEVTLWMADEAVLGLVGYDTPRPLPQFYGHRPAGMSNFHLRTAVVLGSPDLEALDAQDQKLQTEGVMSGGAPAGRYRVAKSAPRPAPSTVANAAPMEEAEFEAKDGESSPDTGATFAVRKNFDPLAIFAAEQLTDSAGKTKVKVTLPDNLTRYRIFSVAVEGENRMGSGDQALTARLPIMVRPSLPRFLNFGDKARLPVVIQNQTDKPLKVEIVGQASGVQWLGDVGQQVEVPAKDRVEVQFEASADAVGEAHFRFGAVAGKFSDAATLSLPVYTPASGEAFATYGSIAKSGEAINQPVKRPGDVWSQFGGLQVSFSSTALSELTDAFLYLYRYPYECAEQKASRILAIAAMREVLEAFNADDMPAPKAINSHMAQDLSYLARLQNSDGGWQYWRRTNQSVPFVSLHVSHALVRAKLEGYKIDENALQRALGYLRQIEEKCRSLRYSQSTIRTIAAYALYVRELAGDTDLGRAKSLFAELKSDNNLEALGWLWPVLSKHAQGSFELSELRRLVQNKATETADKAQFTMSYGKGDGELLLLHSSRRTDAILLYALLTDQPKHTLNTKLVKGLLAHRVRGRWNNTQENIWILLALQKYFQVYEKETPDFLARVWLDKKYLGQEKFVGRSAKEGQLNIPMAEVSEQQTDLIIGKQGPGRLYYRVGMKYAPKSLRLPAVNRGFLVERKFKGIDSPDDVKQSENGDWEVKAGAKVEVELTMVVPERRYHVALVDPLPAGLEPLNPVLQGTPPTSHGGGVSQGRYGGWWWHWYQHENMRDERVEAFAQLLYPGVYTYRYTALATTPGEYVLPPTKAEEMYSPEVYGRTATARLMVK